MFLKVPGGSWRLLQFWAFLKVPRVLEIPEGSCGFGGSQRFLKFLGVLDFTGSRVALFLGLSLSRTLVEQSSEPGCNHVIWNYRDKL